MNLSFLQGLPWYAYIIPALFVASFLYKKIKIAKGYIAPGKPKWNYSMGNPDIKKAYELARQKDFLGLEELVKGMPDDVRYFTFEHVGNQKDGLDLVNEWYESEPDNETAQLFKAVAMLKKAWDVRGHGTSAMTKDADMELFRSMNKDTNAFLKKCIASQKNPSVDFYTELLATMKAMDVERSDLHETFEKGKSISPNNIGLHKAYWQTLTEKWGGSQEEVADYMKTLDKNTLLYAIIQSGEFRDNTYFMDYIPKENRPAVKDAMKEFVKWADTVEDQPMNLHRYPFYENMTICAAYVGLDSYEKAYAQRMAVYTDW